MVPPCGGGSVSHALPLKVELNHENGAGGIV